jgi:5'-methylthioadenosine phosphorylase
LLSRHGEGHLLHPSTVPFRANIFALKKLGVKHILASAAVGSLRDAMAPRDLVVPDQVIDKTYRRAGTFFDELAVHVEMANPFCPFLRRLLGEAANGLPVKVHTHATYVCMEGPQFSTRAESEMHRAWGGDLIGMTLMPEAKLAREAEICYAAVALVTDYDCWRERAESEDKMRLLDEILANVKVATQNALNLVHRAIPHVASQGGRACACQSALELAIWSDRARITPELRARLAPITGKYLP